MLTPLQLIQNYLGLKNLIGGIILLITIYSFYKGFQRYHHSDSHPRNFNKKSSFFNKDNLIIGIILVILGCFIYFSFFKQAPNSGKWAGKLMTEVDQAIDQLETINAGYQTLGDKWETERKKAEAALMKAQAEHAHSLEEKMKAQKALEKSKKDAEYIKEEINKTHKTLEQMKKEREDWEKKRKEKEKEIEEQEEELKKSVNTKEREKIQKKIDTLQAEESEIIKKIEDIDIEIGKLESTLNKLRNQQKLVLDLQRQLQESYDFFTQDEKFKFNKVKHQQELYDELKRKQNETAEKKIKLEAQITLLKKLKPVVLGAKSSADDYDRKNTFWNLNNWSDFIGNVVSETLQLKKIIYFYKESKNIYKETQNIETPEERDARVKKEHTAELTKDLGAYKSLFVNTDGTYKMISRSTCESIMNDINRDIKKYEADLKDEEQKFSKYTKDIMNIRDLTSEAEHKSQTVVTTKRNQELREYEELLDKLTQRQKEANRFTGLNKDKQIYNKKLHNINIEIQALEEELRARNPRLSNVEERKNMLKQQENTEAFREFVGADE